MRPGMSVTSPRSMAFTGAAPWLIDVIVPPSMVTTTFCSSASDLPSNIRAALMTIGSAASARANRSAMSSVRFTRRILVGGRMRAAMERITNYRVIVVGSGPAGCTASIYLFRANLAPLVLEGLQPGGQLTITTDVENYPGFPEGILGPKLMDLMRQQAERFGAVFKMEQVESVQLRTHPFEITTDQHIYECDALIIAAGASAMQIGLPSEKELQGFGVSYCATCDGFFFRGKEIAVVGGGDSAMEEATFLRS